MVALSRRADDETARRRDKKFIQDQRSEFQQYMAEHRGVYSGSQRIGTDIGTIWRKMPGRRNRLGELAGFISPHFSMFSLRFGRCGFSQNFGNLMQSFARAAFPHMGQAFNLAPHPT